MAGRKARLARPTEPTARKLRRKAARAVVCGAHNPAARLNSARAGNVHRLVLRRAIAAVGQGQGRPVVPPPAPRYGASFAALGNSARREGFFYLAAERILDKSRANLTDRRVAVCLGCVVSQRELPARGGALSFFFERLAKVGARGHSLACCLSCKRLRKLIMRVGAELRKELRGHLPMHAAQRQYDRTTALSLKDSWACT